MKMISYQRNNSRAPLFGALVVVSIAAAFFGADYLLGGAVRMQVRGVAAAAQGSIAAASNSIFGSGILVTRGHLARENDALRAEIALRGEEIARFESLEEENRTLRSLADLADREEGVSAHFLSSFSTSAYGTYLIDVGTESGVQEGDLVLTPGGFVLGTIVSAARTESTVRSIFAPGTRIDLVSGDIAFVADGRGGANARAEVPREATVAIGDIVRAPSVGGRPVGVIGAITSASSSATQILHINLPVNVNSLQFVYVTR